MQHKHYFDHLEPYDIRRIVSSMDKPFLIHVRYITCPAYIRYDLRDKTEWLVYADTESSAMDKLEKHLRSFIIDEPKVGDPMMLDMSSVTIL
jgi:hypothetical protein